MKHLAIFVIIALSFDLTAMAADDTPVFRSRTSVVEKEVVESDQGSVGLTGANTPFSLLDLSKFHMSHSYGLTYFSGAGQSEMIAMYLNQIDYDITRTLRLSVGLAWVHQPQATLGLSTQTVSNRLLPSLRLDWRPSDKFHLRVDYRTLSPSTSYYYSRDRYYQGFYDDDPGVGVSGRENDKR
jgi:hypothetical protein